MIRKLPLLLAALACAAHAQYKGKYVGWSTGYYYGGTLSEGVFKAFTHLMNFHVTVSASGALGTGDLRGSDQAAFVSTCHAHGVKALLSIGGEGEHPGFAAACSNPSTQTTLVKNILAMTLKYGYDGVDLDWEVAEDPDYDKNPANVAHFLSFHTEVRDSVRNHQPLMITAAITDDWYPNCSAAVCSIMDQANSMSYDQTAASEWRDASIVFKLGAPKANHGIGFDMNDLADNLAKCRLAIDSGFGGVMAWDVGKSSANAYDSIAHYVTHSSTVKIGAIGFAADKGLRPRLVLGCGAWGTQSVAYAVPAGSAGAWIDLGLYDAAGARVGNLFRGASPAGTHTVDLGNPAAGRYVIKLAAGAAVLDAHALVVGK